jgi:NAD-dependent deacetylase
MEERIKGAASILAETSTLVVLSGAGVSKESGIPTFREAQTGLWARYDPQQLATRDAFRRNPQLVWEWYEYRRELVARTGPNPGHRALAEMERYIPHVIVLTQNIDGFHQAAGSSDVVELHGNIRRSKCFANCHGEPTLVNVIELPDREGASPHCPYCGDLIRPDVVWFGEALPGEALGRAMRASAEGDAMLVVGTSGVVYPAAALPQMAKEAGNRVIEVNPEASGITPLADLFLAGPAGMVLPQLLAGLASLRQTEF